jgi:hypothetical protein
MINHMAIDEANGVLILAENGKDMVVNCTWDQYKQGYADYQNGKLMQEAFPFLNANEREFLMTGISPEEWNALFGGENDYDDIDP